jgi:ABC-type multidrug transport system fused ATPase/permease subunit
VDPITSIGTVLIFGAIALLLYKLMHERAGHIGMRNAELAIKGNEKIIEVFSSYRESVVRNRRDYYAREIAKTRYEFSDLSAEMSFMPYISKYVIETTVIVGAVLIGAVQFVMKDASQAVATLAIFVAAGTRIAPAVLRIQQGFLSIRANSGQIEPTMKLTALINESMATPRFNAALPNGLFVSSEVKLDVVAKDLGFFYSDANQFSIKNVSLRIPFGSMTAIVGGSGAGKSTLVDLLLGVLIPNSGSLYIGEFKLISLASTMIPSPNATVSFLRKCCFANSPRIRWLFCLHCRETCLLAATSE